MVWPIMRGSSGFNGRDAMKPKSTRTDQKQVFLEGGETAVLKPKIQSLASPAAKTFLERDSRLKVQIAPVVHDFLRSIHTADLTGIKTLLSIPRTSDHIG